MGWREFREFRIGLERVLSWIGESLQLGWREFREFRVGLERV